MSELPSNLDELREQVSRKFGDANFIEEAEKLGFQRARENGNLTLPEVVSPQHDYASSILFSFLLIAMQRGELLDFSTLAHRMVLALEGLEVIQ